MIKCVTCHLDSIRPKVGCHCLWPAMLSMQEHGSCHLLWFLDPSFGNAILVVGINTSEAETLVAGLANLLPSIGCKDSIISMIVLDMDAMGEAEVLECLLANDGLLCID